MQSDKLNRKSEYIDKDFAVIEPFNALCCPKKFAINESIKVIEQMSSNRLRVMEIETNFCHKVKRSTLNRCCKLCLQEN